MTPDQAGLIVEDLGEAFGRGDVEAVLAQFASGDVVYAGSERGEVALGRSDLRALLTEIFARDERYSWRCHAVHVTACAAGFAVLADATLLVDPHPAGGEPDVNADSDVDPDVAAAADAGAGIDADVGIDAGAGVGGDAGADVGGDAGAGGRESFPYRVSGLLEAENGDWRWRFCHGSEPAPSSPG